MRFVSPHSLGLLWPWLLPLLRATVAAPLVKDRAEVTLVNFAAHPVRLQWYDAAGDTYLDVATLAPYESTRMDSFVGHTFAYNDGDEENKVLYHVTQAQDVHVVGLPNKSDSIPVICGTTKGDLHITVKPSWSPLGAARFLELVHNKYWDGCALNRVVKGFLTQFGIGKDYEQRTAYRQATILDDAPSRRVFQPGYLAYAGSGPDSRTTEIFVVMPDTPPHQLNAFGRNPWETPFGYVDPDDLMNVVDQWYAYGDMPPWGTGPDPQQIYARGGYEMYLPENFPDLDYITTCQMVRDDDPVEEEL